VSLCTNINRLQMGSLKSTQITNKVTKLENKGTHDKELTKKESLPEEKWICK